MTDKAFQIVEETYTLLDETDKLKKQWYASKESIESAKQMGITAQGYIGSMEATFCPKDSDDVHTVTLG